MQIKTTRYHLTLVRMAIIKKSTNNKCWRGCTEKRILLHCWWEYKLIQPLWKTVWRFLKKLGIKPSCDPAIPLLGIYPEVTKIEKDTCTPMFIAALFTIDRTWKQPRCPLTDECIKSWVHTHNGILLSFKKERFWVNSNEVDEHRASLVRQYHLSRFHIYVLVYNIYLSLSDLLHSIIGSRFIHLIRTDSDAFLFMANILLYICIRVSLFIYLLMDN